jgi:hypothetical protein
MLLFISTGSDKSESFIGIVKELIKGTVFEKVVTGTPRLAEGRIVTNDGGSAPLYRKLYNMAGRMHKKK